MQITKLSRRQIVAFGQEKQEWEMWREVGETISRVSQHKIVSKNIPMWNPARNFKVPLRKKATGIEDVLILLFKDHLQSIGSLLYPNPYPSMRDTVSHPFIHNGQQRPQQLLEHVYAFKQKQRDKGRHPEKHTVFKPSKNQLGRKENYWRKCRESHRWSERQG